MPLYKTEGIVLRKQEYGETGEFVSLLSPDYGKMKVLVKGVRKIKGSLVGKFELFCDVRMLIASGKAFDICSQVETISSYPGIREDLAKMTYGLYYLEIFNSLIAFSEPHAGIHKLLRKTLSVLEEGKNLELLSVFVVYHLLRLLGYQPVLSHCVLCGKDENQSRFSVSLGGMLCKNCKESDLETLPVSKDIELLLGKLVRTPFHAMGSDSLKQETARDARKILELFIEYNLSRRFKTPALIKKVTSLLS